MQQFDEKRLADLAMTFAKNALTTAKSQPAIDAKAASKIDELKQQFEEVQVMQNNVQDILGHISSIQKSMKRKFDQLSKLTEDMTEGTAIDENVDASPATPEVTKKKKERAPTAYNLFIKKTIPEIKAKHPELGKTDLMTQAAAAWRKKKQDDLMHVQEDDTANDDTDYEDEEDYEDEDDQDAAQKVMEEGRMLCEQFRQGIGHKRMRTVM